MRRLLGLSTMALLAALPAVADVTVRTLSQQYPAASAEKIHLEIPIGSLEVVAVPGNQVKVDMRLDCDRISQQRCVDLAKRLELVEDGGGDKIRVRLKGWPKASGPRRLEVHVRAEVPRHLPLRAELGVGELKVSGGQNRLVADVGVGEVTIEHVQGDVDVKVGVGEATVRMREAAVASARLEVGIGETSLRAGGKRVSGSGFLGGDLKWNKGQGASRIHADIGVGEISVRLE